MMALCAHQMSAEQLARWLGVYSIRPAGHLPLSIFFEVTVSANQDWFLKRLAYLSVVWLGHKTEGISVVQRGEQRWLAR
jgi:hypothetical protein